MAQTLTRILVHLIYSTKDRRNFIKPAIEPELYAYTAAIAKTNESLLLAIGGTLDHVHLLLSMSKNIALADIVMAVKKDSSKWIKTKGPDFRDFHWQEGYGAFSIGESQVAAVKAYIAGQKTHHRTVSFQDELLAFLKKYNLPYDQRYLWT